MNSDFDVILVGSGINSLICAALAAKQGLRICVLERDRHFGGCVRSEELTHPGFVHDTLSGFHPLFITSPGYAELRGELTEVGLQYCNSATPTGVLLQNDAVAVLTTSRTRNEIAFNALCPGDGAAYATQMQAFERSSRLTFGLLGGEMWSASTLRLLLAEAWRLSPRGLLAFFGEALQTSRQWLDTHFRGAALKALLAPWVLHTGLGPDHAMSGFMNRLIAFTLEAAGMPVVKGGSGRLIVALKQLIERRGGVLLADQHVSRVLVKHGRAAGVQLMNGKQVAARKAVVCNVTPTQLYLSLLAPEFVPEAIQRSARGYRYGRSGMQIHLALSEPPRWRNAQAREVVMLHLCSGIDSVATAVSESERGLLPAEPTVVIGQPTVIDSTRAPPGAAILWIQLQELPAIVRGDALGHIKIPASGQWSSALKEAYADRIIQQLRSHIDNLDDCLLSRCVLSPADLEARNINLVGGDPYAGACSIEQSFLWRPLTSTIRHETHIKNLYHIGASTHPGPGLGGISGYLVAKAL
ncbi:MAG TPA: NAD(P)/FAD-dependent oxidoreductase [Steroidobacteraceae bacterium]